MKVEQKVDLLVGQMVDLSAVWRAEPKARQTVVHLVACSAVHSAVLLAHWLVVQLVVLMVDYWVGCSAAH